MSLSEKIFARILYRFADSMEKEFPECTKEIVINVIYNFLINFFSQNMGAEKYINAIKYLKKEVK